MPLFETIWERTQQYEGEVFTQIRGGQFKYAVQNGCVKPDRVNQIISRNQFERAFQFVPLDDTKPIQKLRGPSYIYAILMDKRIRKNDW